jgi:hypothetical protein
VCGNGPPTIDQLEPFFILSQLKYQDTDNPGNGIINTWYRKWSDPRTKNRRITFSQVTPDEKQRIDDDVRFWHVNLLYNEL